ncbi:MAG: D-aminoacyl-tRNA deacylase [Bacilli bacterium]
MKVVVQRVITASVTVDEKLISQTKEGLLLFIGFTHDDTIEKIDYIINKIIKLRIFKDENGNMNKSLLDINGEILSISQFTLYSDTIKGNRPSFINSMNKEQAEKLYDIFNTKISKIIPTKTGIFGANMKVNLINDGPVTIILER